jgi:kynureninase
VVVEDVERSEAEELDKGDRLAAWRAQYLGDDGGAIYLDGNSLGRPSHATVSAVADAAGEWQRRLVRGWSDWIDLPTAVGDRLGPLIGAGSGQVVVCDSTTVNLYKVAAAALDHQAGRSVIVGDRHDFPTDRYVLEGLAQATGRQLRLVDSDPVLGADPDEVAAVVGPDTALVCLSHVNYRSGARHDVAAVTEVAHRAGALVVWDLCHSAGAVPVGLDEAGVDLAVGCSYKYLNAGPGAPAFLYVRHDLQRQLRQPIWGWFSQSDQFAMTRDYDPQRGIGRFQTGTPPVLGLTALDAALGPLLDAGIDALWAKSQRLVSLLAARCLARLGPLGVSVASPASPSRRGAHLSVAHPRAWPLCDALVSRDLVVPDFRPPDVVRLGPAPIYTRFVDAWDAVERVAAVLESGDLVDQPDERPRVT